MKKVIIFFCVMIAHTSFCQIEFGIKAGLSSMELSKGDLFISNNDESYTVKVQNANYGYNFGLYTRLSLANIYVEPSFLLNSSKVDYSVDEHIFDTGVLNSVKSETYQNLDIPVMVGLKIGFFRIHGGPVAHIFLNSSSELTDIEGYEQKFNKATFGIQGGIGLDIMRIRIDLNYETNMSLFGEHISIGSQEYAFDDRPSRIVGTIGYKF